MCDDTFYDSENKRAAPCNDHEPNCEQILKAKTIYSSNITAGGLKVELCYEHSPQGRKAPKVSTKPQVENSTPRKEVTTSKVIGLPTKNSPGCSGYIITDSFDGKGEPRENTVCLKSAIVPKNDDDFSSNLALTELIHQEKRESLGKRKRVSFSPNYFEGDGSSFDATRTDRNQRHEVNSLKTCVILPVSNVCNLQVDSSKPEILDLTDETPSPVQFVNLAKHRLLCDSNSFSPACLFPDIASDALTEERGAGEYAIIKSQNRLFLNDSVGLSLPLEQNLEGETVFTDQMQSQDESKPTYSLITSAYVQNLAEMCYSVQNDIRWTVLNRAGRNVSQQLLAWSKGDDLSVVTALAHEYKPTLWTSPTSFSKTESGELACGCFICREDSNDKKTNAFTIETCLDKNSMVTEESTEGDASMIYLYCRLFYRKGPWFRLDDVYQKYYLPTKQAWKNKSNEKIKFSNAESNGLRHEVDEEKLSNFVNANDEVFSNPPAKRVSKTSTDEVVIDEMLLNAHMDSLLRLLQDLDRLKSSGWIRSFVGEEECGKTVGLTLLKVEERSRILSMLGTNGKKRKSSLTGSGFKDKHQRPENEIWKQMQQQRTLVFLPKEHGSRLLPVIHHVNDVILNKLLETIIQSCCPTGYVPVSAMKCHREKINSRINEVFNRSRKDVSALNNHNTSDCYFLSAPMCFRLREQPTFALQRLSRLYLCATAGPGDMRGDGTNGWRSLLKVRKKSTPLSKMIPPPGEHTWFQVQYPGLSHRFGLRSCSFFNSFRSLPVKEHSKYMECCDSYEARNNLRFRQVFTSQDAFCAWELCVELRASTDYLMELNELIRSNLRRQLRTDKITLRSKNVAFAEKTTDSVDLLNLLNENGRIKIIRTMLKAIDEFNCFDDVFLMVERRCQTYRAYVVSECEHVLGVIGILITEILCACNKFLSHEEIQLIADRPWLRHMVWSGCLSYILWDIIPVFERIGAYELAIDALEVLLFGLIRRLDSVAEGLIPEIVFPAIETTTRLAPLLLSRRARGKGFDRLVIDYTHLHRRNLLGTNDAALKRSSCNAMNSQLMRFCESIVCAMSQTSSIGFSAIRSIARRRKRPLCKALTFCLEAQELGLRYGNVNDLEKIDSKYSDWSAITDRTIANAIDGTQDTSGKRCSFVGFEEGENHTFPNASLNVEQLALEYYKTGRLPSHDKDSASFKGGWSGFHDEGGHVRALFRILCSAPVLGMDWGCILDVCDDKENSTIHLTPYQGAPFDLHVGFEIRMNEGLQNPSRGFYFRRQQQIHGFLEKLSNLGNQELCDLVYDSIKSRIIYCSVHRIKDPVAERDAAQVRTLSLIAAGCGGNQLSSIFRCLFFDYRHYSGGMPDLLLVRALFEGAKHTSAYELVNLAEWVGESFMESQESMNFLIDTDDDFLGCSKIGDSGGRSNRAGPFRLPTTTPAKPQKKFTTMEILGERLILRNNGRDVRVECMMVEVKSSNDRLDPRQEDWLNILDRSGNARVCKFEKSKSDPKPTPKINP